MKFKLEEHIKHRLVGVIVLASLAIVFIPAIMKQSNYRFDKKMHVAIKLPDKPLAPVVEIPNKKVMFKNLEVVKVDIPHVEEKRQLAAVVEAKPFSSLIPVNKQLANKKTELPATKVKIHNTTDSDIDNAKYTVHLSSFSIEKNAQDLVTRLKSEGYNAFYGRYSGKNGKVYTVMLRKLDKKDAQAARKQLAQSAMRLEGILVKV